MANHRRTTNGALNEWDEDKTAMATRGDGTGDGHALCCKPNPSCGNGKVDHAEEVCDDGNLKQGDGCNVTCYPTVGKGC